MKVILLDNIKGVGKKEEVINDMQEIFYFLKN